ncbi:MAG: N-acetyltransferase [Candidatus Thorarchaeota archaeon]|nr:N-acetyltransferase [Candidatus Thorarchaeota archaeon]
MYLKDQPEPDEAIWLSLKEKLSEILSDDVNIFFPQELEDYHVDWFMDLERVVFRSALRYSEDEIFERLQTPGHLLMYVVVNSIPEAMLFGYALPSTYVKTFHLDTIAVKQQRKGIGSRMIEALIDWARTENFLVISVDTEVEDEKGIQLQRFYEGLGFSIVAREDSGNLTMKLVL